MSSISKAIFLGLLFVIGAAVKIHAQGETGTGTLSGVPAGGGLYDYTIMVNNTGPTTIGSVWYAWIPGEFFLPTVPSSAGAPIGWGANIAANSIQYTANTPGDYLASGHSISFTFSSFDTPAVLNGLSSVYPGTPIGTSFLYSGGLLLDPGYEFVVQPAPVPEPSSFALLTAGSLGLLVARWRKLRRQ